jgi:hypothetical protein
MIIFPKDNGAFVRKVKMKREDRENYERKIGGDGSQLSLKSSSTRD